MNFITEPFQYAFIQRAVLAAVITGVLCACLGTFVVLRRMSVVGHALTHSALPGMVAAYLLGGSIFIGAAAATMITAFGIGFLSKDDKVYEDTSVGMVPTVMFALGVLLISAGKSYRDLSAMLFGNILGITSGDLKLIALITGATLLMLAFFYKELKLLCIDPDYAKAIGIPLHMLRYGLLLFLALTVVVGIQSVGTVLTNALLVVPAATARLLTDRLGTVMLLAGVFAVLSVLAGVFVSYYFSLSSGAAIVLACALIFVCVWLARAAKVKFY
ncbi:MAG: metal ABC transporter permease [Candidatus Omnitrophica bacterium]|nr:metal ABC transporter permease [Candidatus Omnitrophota bacterium]